MELINLEGLTLGSVLAGLISAAVLFLLTKFVRWLGKHRAIARIAFTLTCRFEFRMLSIALSALVCAVLWERFGFTVGGERLNGIIVGLVAFSLLTFIYEWRFAHVGLHAAQLTVSSGTDYATALNLCRDGFSFLGTGAAKLTSSPNFESTIVRCSHSSVPIRFLLSRPNNEVIEDAEKKSGASPGTYKHNVITSLKTLKKLRDERGVQIQVRFYEGKTPRDFQNFRMMFIDDHILLLSYNVYGKGNGQELPQVVLFRSRLESLTDNFYFAYSSYYERLWNDSDEWDFQQYVV